MAGEKQRTTKIRLESWKSLDDEEEAIALFRNMIKMGSPVVYRGNVLSWLVHDELGIRAQVMTEKNLMAETARTTLYLKQKLVEIVDANGVPEIDKKTKKILYQYKERVDRVPSRVLDIAFGMYDKAIYKVKGVLTHPIINKEGKPVIMNGLYWKEEDIKGIKVKKPFIHIYDGYDPISQYFFAVPETVVKHLEGIGTGAPTKEQVEEAVAFLEFFFIDFIFATKSARASAAAFLLTVLCREIIEDYVPMLEVRAPMSHSGKSTLVKMMLWALTGQEPAMFTPNFRNKDEFEKELLSQLLQGQNYVFMDNVTSTVQSSFLDMVLKSGYANKRLLGSNVMATVYSGMPFVMTANNPTLSEDIKNRIYLLDILKPPDNTQFVHKNPRKRALEMGPMLIKSLLVLYNNWVYNHEKKLFKTRRMEGFIEWSEVIGGILEAAGIEGFLDDTLKQIKEVDTKKELAADFAASWYEKYGSAWTFVKDVFDLGVDAGYVAAADNRQKKLQTIANFLKKNRGVQLPGGYCFEHNDGETRGSQWKVVKDASR